MHAQVTVTKPPDEGGSAVSNVQTSGPDDPSASGGAARMAAAAAAAAQAGEIDTGVEPLVQPDEPPVNVPVKKTEWDKTPRNAPCPCGSGKKFKMCHGR
jgi:preprotein translocase subunit SecA